MSDLTQPLVRFAKAWRLLDKIARRGIAVWFNGETFVGKPRDELTADERQQLDELRGEVAATLLYGQGESEKLPPEVTDPETRAWFAAFPPETRAWILHTARVSVHEGEHRTAAKAIVGLHRACLLLTK